jgi:hypothetical protein
LLLSDEKPQTKLPLPRWEEIKGRGNCFLHLHPPLSPAYRQAGVKGEGIT